MNGGSWTKMMERAVMFLLTIIMGFIAWQSTNWSKNIESLSNNVAELNIKMQVIVAQVGAAYEKFLTVYKKDDEQDKELTDHEARIRVIEKTK